MNSHHFIHKIPLLPENKAVQKVMRIYVYCYIHRLEGQNPNRFCVCDPFTSTIYLLKK